MIDLDIAGIGSRVSRYRKLNGDSAQKLADRAGLTRAVVVNVESGRKADVGVRDLVSIAWALGVTPVALLFDVTSPKEGVQTPEGMLLTESLIAWIQGPMALGLSQPARPTPAFREVVQVLASLSLLYSSQGRLVELEAAVDRVGGDPEWALDERQRLVEQMTYASGQLAERGVSLDHG